MTVQSIIFYCFMGFMGFTLNLIITFKFLIVIIIVIVITFPFNVY